MNNIFENAKFGDKYELKDGKTAIFSRYIYSNGKPNMIALVTAYEKVVYVNLDGSSCSTDKNLCVKI